MRSYEPGPDVTMKKPTRPPSARIFWPSTDATSSSVIPTRALAKHFSKAAAAMRPDSTSIAISASDLMRR